MTFTLTVEQIANIFRAGQERGETIAISYTANAPADDFIWDAIPEVLEPLSTEERVALMRQLKELL